MPLPLLALPLMAKIGIGLSAAGGLKGILSGAKMKKEANQIKPVFDAPEVSQSIKDMQGLAQTRMNSRNPYAEANRRAALGGQANAMGAIKRTALDPSQALALAASTQGQLDQSLFNLGQQDVAFDQQNMANLMNAQNAMSGEERYVNQVNNQKYQMDMGQKNALTSAGNQSIVGGLQNIGSTLFSAGMTGGTGGGSTGGGKGIFNMLMKNPQLMQTMQMGANQQAMNNFDAQMAQIKNNLPKVNFTR